MNNSNDILEFVKFKQEINEVLDYCIAAMQNNESIFMDKQRLVKQVMSYYTRMKCVYESSYQSDDEKSILSDESDTSVNEEYNDIFHNRYYTGNSYDNNINYNKSGNRITRQILGLDYIDESSIDNLNSESTASNDSEHETLDEPFETVNIFSDTQTEPKKVSFDNSFFEGTSYQNIGSIYNTTHVTTDARKYGNVRTLYSRELDNIINKNEISETAEINEIDDNNNVNVDSNIHITNNSKQIFRTIIPDIDIITDDNDKIDYDDPVIPSI